MVEERKVKEGYKKTQVGIIPEDWDVKILGEISEIIMGQSPNSQFYNSDECGLPLVQGNADIKNRKTIDRIYTTEVTKKCDKNDLIMTVRAPVGKIAKASYNSCIGRGVCAIKGGCDYLYHFLINMEKGWLALSKGSTFDSINSEDIYNLKVIIPNLEEQKVIAKALTDTDNLIHSIQNLINKKEKIKQGTMQELLTGKKRLDGFSGEWENIKLGEIDLFISDGNYGELYPRPNEFVESGVPFLRANNIYKNNVVGKDLRFISNEKHQLLKSGHLKEADILITTRGDIGNTAIVPKEFDGSNINAQICLIRVNEKEKVNAMFIHYSLISNYVQNQIKTLQTGSALKQLPKGNLGKIEFKLPEIKEQKSISQILSHMDQEIQGLKEKLEKYKTIKQGMMQELLTGRIRLI